MSLYFLLSTCYQNITMQLTAIGHTLKAHGIKGELKVKIDDRYLEAFFNAHSIFIRVGNAPLPYFIEEIRGGNMIIVRLEDVKSRETAQSLSHSDILLKNEELEQLELPPIPYSYQSYVGFTLKDKELGNIGVIDSVMELPQQEVAVVTYEGREVLIPLHENLIEAIEEKEKTIILDLPTGILDLNNR